MANQSYLTEFILSIHHEVQSAVDFIASVAQKEGTELGRSEALMHIETLRIKLPFNMELENVTQKMPETETQRVATPPNEPEQVATPVNEFQRIDINELQRVPRVKSEFLQTAMLENEPLRVNEPLQAATFAKEPEPLKEATATEIRSLLSARKGFMLEMNPAEETASYAKLKVDMLPSLPGDRPETARAEMEIVFSPLQRK